MFKVQNTILSEDIATAKFACDLPRCKGDCCVVGEAGAPISVQEVPQVKKAWNKLEGGLRPQARDVVDRKGLIWGNKKEGFELATVDGRECVFVTYTDDGVAHCAIQKAFMEGRIDWEKPLSCHLFPIRLKRIVDFDYANFEYVDELCAPACKKGKKEGRYLSEFLEKPLIRRYGTKWYDEFREACNEIRTENGEAASI